MAFRTLTAVAHIRARVTDTVLEEAIAEGASPSQLRYISDLCAALWGNSSYWLTQERFCLTVIIKSSPALQQASIRSAQ